MTFENLLPSPENVTSISKHPRYRFHEPITPRQAIVPETQPVAQKAVIEAPKYSPKKEAEFNWGSPEGLWTTDLWNFCKFIMPQVRRYLKNFYL